MLSGAVVSGMLLAGLVPVAPPAAAAGCQAFGQPQNVGHVRDLNLNEISGLVASRVHSRTLWVHEDNGNPADVTALSSRGVTLATVGLKGASNSEDSDWEDIAFADGALWVGDIGDNNLPARDWVRVYWFPEPDLTATSVTPSEARFIYPAGGSPDAEALLVDGVSDEMFVLSKQWNQTKVFRGDLAGISDGDQRQLELVTTLTSSDSTLGRTTAADMGEPGVLVKGNTWGLLYPWTPTGSVEDALAGTPCPLPVTPGESLGLNRRQDGYYMIPEGNRPDIHRSLAS